MPDKTITVTNGDGSTKTITIPDRSRFAGIRTMSRVTGGVSDDITVDRTAQVVTSDRKGESRPLLSKVVGGASAAYSLRDLNDKAGNNKVVRVRRASDNHEKDFRAKEIKDIETWVNAQTVLPLDIQELEADGRTGALVEAAAAYSLRNLSSSYAGDVVEVRRNTDGSTQDFNATEVSDNTLTDWVNTSFADDLPLDTSSGAAAAYSLRNLSSSFTGSVVEVRRSSDGEEDSFTAAEVADGTLTDWVNGASTFYNFNSSKSGWQALSGTTTLSSDSPYSGANSLRVTGNVRAFNINEVGQHVTVSGFYRTDGIASLRIDIGDNNEAATLPPTSTWTSFSISSSQKLSYIRNFFDAFPTSGWAELDDVTISQTTSDGFVSKWYDQSGNANHATQGTNASQPKIVDAGALVTGGLDFDGDDDTLVVTGNPVITANSAGTYSGFSVQTVDTSVAGYIAGNASPSNGSSLLARGSSDFTLTNKNSGNFDNISRAAGKNILSACYNNGDASLLVNGGGSMVDAGAYGFSAGTSDFRIGSRNPSDIFLEGKIEEIIIYDSDQSDKRRAIEENIGDHYGITLASFSNDGFVKTWYDQSGNTNHATQGTNASQPKIVDAGSLTTNDNGNPTIRFDGVDDILQAPQETSLYNNAHAIFNVAELLSSPTTADYISGGFNNTSTNRERIAFGTFNRQASNPSYITSGNSLITALYSGVSSGGLQSPFVNGVAQTTANETTTFTDLDAFDIGGSLDFSRFTNANIQEIIIYDSDQSDNRTAIEANIGETYSIDLPSGVDTGYDQVDGFVETWYDQSGNGNDAVQQVSGSQPKIVDGGVLVSGGLDFDGVDDFFNFDTSISFSGTPASIFAVQEAQGSSNDATLGASSGGNSLTFKRNELEYNLSASTIDINPSGLDAGDEKLLTVIHDGTSGNPNVRAYLDGSEVIDGSPDPDQGSLNTAVVSYIGKKRDGLSGAFLNGVLKELIIYVTDQSANRAAIEANINNQYDIY